MKQSLRNLEFINYKHTELLFSLAKLRWKVTSLLVQDNWRPYVVSRTVLLESLVAKKRHFQGRVRFRIQLRDEDGLFMCVNGSATLQD